MALMTTQNKELSPNPIRDVTTEDLVRDLRALGVRAGQLVNAKISLSSIGRVAGGARSLIDALIEVLGPEGTLVSDAFVESYPLPLSTRNAQKIVDEKTPSYAGAFANAMIKHPRGVRSRHPIQKFAAIGALAETLMREHTAASGAYDVLARMAESGGLNLKIGSEEKVAGVGTTHVVLCALGYRQKPLKHGVMYREVDGTIRLFVRNWVGGCARGYLNLAPLYRDGGAVLAEGNIGMAPAKITDMQRTLAIEMEALRENPRLILCGDPLCESCRIAWEFSDTSPLVFGMRRAISFPRRALGWIHRRVAARRDGVRR